MSQISAVLVWNAEKNVRESGAAREVSSKFSAGGLPQIYGKSGGCRLEFLLEGVASAKQRGSVRVLRALSREVESEAKKKRLGVFFFCKPLSQKKFDCCR